MIKWFRRLVLGAFVLLVLGIVAVVVVSMRMDDMVKQGIETVGSRVTGTDVTVDEVSLSPLTGAGRITGLVVGSPEGFAAERAFGLEQLSVKVDPKTVMGDVIRVEEIVVDGADVTWEVSRKGVNLMAIHKHIRDVVGAEDEQPAEPQSEAGARKIIVDRFVFRNGTTRVHLPVGRDLTVELPELELTGIGEKSGGQTAMEASAQILSALIRHIGTTVSEQVGGKAGFDLSSFEDRMKGVFDDTIGTGADKLKETGDKIKDEIGRLFDR
jgi:hypothetical protein